MEHRWKVGYWKVDISTMCSSAYSIQQRKPDRYSFSNGWVIYHWIRYFQVFPTPSTFGTGNGNEAGGIFLSGLVCLITGWMEHTMRTTPRSSVQNSGRDSRTSHTDTQTDRADRSNTQIHSWMNLRNDPTPLYNTWCMTHFIMHPFQQPAMFVPFELIEEWL
jgi:hypothetical protein